MRDQLTSDDRFAEVMLTRSNFRGAILVLEGESDCRVFDQFVDPQTCKTIPAFGKELVLETVRLAEEAKVGGVVGIVDADYWILDDDKPPSDSILVTDGHDVEIMLLRSVALDRVLRQFGSQEKISRFVSDRGITHIREHLLQEALPLGLLGWVNQKKRWFLSFDEVEVTRYIDRSNLQLAVDRLFERVLQANDYRYEVRELFASVKEVAAQDPDPYHACNGHDIVCFLSVGLRSALGSRRAQECRAEQVEMSLRLAYRETDLRKTTLYAAAKAWEGDNPPYTLFTA